MQPSLLQARALDAAQSRDEVQDLGVGIQGQRLQVRDGRSEAPTQVIDLDRTEGGD